MAFTNQGLICMLRFMAKKLGERILIDLVQSGLKRRYMQLHGTSPETIEWWLSSKQIKGHWSRACQVKQGRITSFDEIALVIDGREKAP